MKRQIPAFTLILFLLALSGCIGNETAPEDIEVIPPADEIIEQCIDAESSIESYGFEYSIISRSAGVTEGDSSFGVIEVNVHGNGLVDHRNRRYKSTIVTSLLGMETVVETYIINGTEYMDIPRLGWVKNATPENMPERPEQLRANAQILENAMVSEIESGEYAGIPCYILSMEPDRDLAESLITGEVDGLPIEPSGDLSGSLREIHTIAWIGKNDHILRRLDSSISMEDDGTLYSLNGSMSFYGFNEQFVIEPPQDAMDARFIDEILGS